MGAKKSGIQKIDDTHFKVSVNAPAVEGRANRAILRILAEYFGLKLVCIKLISGLKSKKKIFDIGGL